MYMDSHICDCIGHIHVSQEPIGWSMLLFLYMYHKSLLVGVCYSSYTCITRAYWLAYATLLIHVSQEPIDWSMLLFLYMYHKSLLVGVCYSSYTYITRAYWLAYAIALSHPFPLVLHDTTRSLSSHLQW